MRSSYFFCLLFLLIGCVKSSPAPNPPITPIPVVTIPNAPTDLKGVLSTPIPSQFDLIWTDASNNEDGFKIERKSGTDAYSLLTTLSQNSVTYSDKGIISGTNYTYRVYSFNSKGNSSYSNEILVKTEDPEAALLRTGLIAYYPFTGNAGDSSGNANHGTINGATLSANRFNSQNSCYSFDGINNSIETGLNQTAIKSFSFSVWFKTSIGGTIITSRQTGDIKPEPGLTIAVHNSATGGVNNGKIIFIGDAPGFSVGTISNNTYLDNKWHHLVANFVGSKSIIDATEFSIYVDNVLISQSISNQYDLNRGVTNLMPINSKSSFLIGMHRSWPSPNFNGQLDDIRIYNRILTLTEISYLFKN